MPAVPTPREFARLLRRMELPARAHLSDLAQRGKLGKDPAEAALVAAAARRELRGRKWLFVLAPLVIILVIVNSVRIQGSVDWSTVLLIVALAATPLGLLRHRRALQRAERLNRKLATEGEQ
jgi:hypothetical protein